MSTTPRCADMRSGGLRPKSRRTWWRRRSWWRGGGWTTRRDDGDTFGLVSEFRSYERLPPDDASAERLELARHPGMKCDDNAAEPRGLGFVNPCAPKDQD